MNAEIPFTKFSRACNYLAEKRQDVGGNDVLYSIIKVSDIDAMYYDTLWHTRRHVEIATTLQRRNFAEVPRASEES